jgi:drug/metabolite transporter (DMT)-like permease
MAQQRRRGTGLALAALSAATFSTSGSLGTSLIDAGWTPGAAVTVRIALAALVLTPFALLQLRGQWNLLRRSSGLIAVYGIIAIAVAQLCYFNAIARLSVGVALLLEYLGAILVVGWLWFRHGQRPRRLTVAGTVTALAGLVFVLNLTSSHHLDPIGVLWGLGAAVGLAAYFVVSSGDPSSERCPLPPLTLAWAGMCVATATLALFGATGLLTIRAPRVDVTLLHHRVSWLVPVLFLSLAAAAFAFLIGITAARLLGPKLASFVGLTEVLFAVAFAWVLLGQVPAGVQFIGGALVLAGVTLVRIDELKAPVLPAEVAGESVESRESLESSPQADTEFLASSLAAPSRTSGSNRLP